MKKIIALLSMIMSMSFFAYSAQIPQLHAIDFAELNRRVEEMINERMQELPYNFSIVSNRSNFYEMMFIFNTMSGVLQLAVVMTLYLFKHQGIDAIPRIPLGSSVSLSLKKMMQELAILPIFMTMSIMRNSATQQIEPFAADFSDKTVLSSLTLTAGIGLALFYKLIQTDYYITTFKKLCAKPLIIKSKIDFDADFLADKECIICHSELENPINCCNQKDHLYCNECLTSWFKELEEKKGIKAFSCSACTQKVTRDNTKISINRFDEMPSYKGFLKSLVGAKGSLLLVLACNVYYLTVLILK